MVLKTPTTSKYAVYDQHQKQITVFILYKHISNTTVKQRCVFALWLRSSYNGDEFSYGVPMANILRTVLTVSGLLPFLILTILMFVLPETSIIVHLLTQYTVVIAAFISGSLFGICLNNKTPYLKIMLITSNLVALAVWLFSVTLAASTFFYVAALLFCVLLSCDLTLYKKKAIKRDYFLLRCLVTLGVATSLLIAGG